MPALSTSWLSDLPGKVQDLKAQFEDLDPKDPSVWPLLPQALLCVALALMCLGAVWYGYLGGLEEELESERAAEVKLRDEFEKKLLKAVSLDGLKKQREQVQHSVLQLEKQLPNRSEMSALLSDINQAGLGRNLQFELFKPGTEVINDYYAELPIAVRVSGQFHDIGMFASDIAHLPRIVTLNQLSMEPKSTGGVLTLEATAKTYRYLDPEEAKAANEQRKGKGAAR